MSGTVIGIAGVPECKRVYNFLNVLTHTSSIYYTIDTSESLTL